MRSFHDLICAIVYWHDLSDVVAVLCFAM